jgi:isoleucyl-tRNA synthetase
MADKQKNEYKDTLNLPRTDFDMRAGLLTKEPAIQARWRAEDLYGQIRMARGGGKRFILHDGPPYANGDIHVGTALNKVLKDMVVRIRTMEGFDSPYIPGWDCHGLPIEQKVMDDLGPKAREMEAMEIRRRCFTYADKFARIQSEQFQRLGVIGEFDDPYITMAPQYEAAVMELFAQLIERGLVFKQLKPVHWSIANQTALADAELEYQNREDTSIYVAFRAVGAKADELGEKAGAPLHLAIWTTTPWTLPANRAVAVGSEIAYDLLRLDTADGAMALLVAQSRREALLATLTAKRPDWLGGHEVVGQYTGAELTDLTYAHPLLGMDSLPVVTADYVTVEDGTGLVHTAPGHGIEDYGTGLKHSLEIACPVGPDGMFDQTAPDWLVGKSVWDGNGLVIEHLRQAGTLLLDENIVHSYPHDWRSKTPTIFRATEQWFIAVDRPMRGSDQSLRDLAMETCRRDSEDGGVDFVPAWGRNRIAGMLESRPDWCISRQRSWGLPIPAFYNPQGQPLLTPASVRAVAKVVAEEGSDAWFTFPPRQLLAGYNPADDQDLDNPEQFDIESLTIGRDIFDVWFESGSSWFAVAMQRGLVDNIPVDLYLEGSDQHRGWFQLSLLPALGTRGRAPYSTLLTHGFIVDEQGYKMSKSLGNFISVTNQMEKRGADILRLWIASQNYQDDVRCSESLIAQSDDAYRKIRNTLRFLMGNCADFDPASLAEEAPAHSLDLWMRMELHRLIRDVKAAYDRYEFHRATRMLYEFCTVQVSSIYLSAVKDRLYCDSVDSVRRRASQTVMHEMLLALVKLLAPILPHTCDEAWDQIPARPADEPHSVHLASLPEYDEGVLELADDLRPVNPDQMTFSPDELVAGPAWIWARMMELRDAGLNKLEALRNQGVKNSLDSEAVLQVSDELTEKVVGLYLSEIEDLLGVGFARVERVESLPAGVWVGVEVLDAREKYPRCARSWKRRPDVGSDADYPELSVRDAAVMKEIAGK